MSGPKKKDGTLTKRAKEMPRFPVILQYEANFTKTHSKMTRLMVKDIIKTADNIVTKKK